MFDCTVKKRSTPTDSVLYSIFLVSLYIVCFNLCIRIQLEHVKKITFLCILIVYFDNRCVWGKRNIIWITSIIYFCTRMIIYWACQVKRESPSL